jgi:hypothetical protein
MVRHLSPSIALEQYFSKVDLTSASIAFYRPQATMFAGICDGKSSAHQNEVVFFQVLTGAGNDRVGVRLCSLL